MPALGAAQTGSNLQAAPAGRSASSPNPGSAPSTPSTSSSSSPATSPPPTPPASAPAPAVPLQTETGRLDGASFRIDIPKNWNRGLVLYFHGYEPTPLTFEPQYPPGRILQEILNRGYAVARSGYAVGGWAVPQAASETEALRRYFRKKHGTPRETFVMGHSMGGLLTVMSLEEAPKDYAGGLALCGVLSPADLVMQRAFATRVAFDAFFPGVLPDVDHIPPTFHMNDIPTITNVQKALDANPEQAALVRQLANIHTNHGLADVLVFNTFVIEDLRLKSGGNPFDNRNLIYTGTANDPLLNERVHRYAADPNAYRFLADWYSPTGNLRRRLLEVHTIYDPLVPAATTGWYNELTRRLGNGDDFVEQYVDRDGHCNITAAQTGVAFDELLNWVHNDQRPTPGLLPGSPAPPVKTPPKPKNPGKPQ
ncbi:MAG TPA: alpha/beta hydrolase [Acidobacteriaceae bacterium]|nr:alpha/beta hydrolase [Acidobacteriaceae bacterium]